MIEVDKISGIGDFEKKTEEIPNENYTETRDIYYVGEKAFLVVNKNTIEVRCDKQLSKLLNEKYESVMMSRYFGRGGIEIVNSGQLATDELDDLIRLSYQLSQE